MLRGKTSVPIPLGGFTFDPLAATFTAAMAKRAGSVFAGAPIVQGLWAAPVPGPTDSLSASAGSLIATNWRSIIDTSQGTISLWVTPEWDGNDGKQHWLVGTPDSKLKIVSASSGYLQFTCYNGLTCQVSNATWVAGTRYHVVARWDKRTLDGTNHACVSVNDSHTYSGTIPTAFDPTTGLNVGSILSTYYPANALIEGLTIYRRPLYDGTYGVDVGNGDEINLIYAAGAGKDPCLITGSWDVVFCLPTNATPGALATGTGEAWSHPHASALLETSWLQDRGYLGGAYALEAPATATQVVDCGSGATLDDLPLSATGFTVEAWARPDSAGRSDSGRLISKRAASLGWEISFGGASITARMYYSGSNYGVFYTYPSDFIGKWHHFAFTFNDAGDKKVRFYIDSVLVATGDAAAGSYTSDAATDLLIGSDYANYSWDGPIGWVRLSNSIRYTTSFVPPRALPAADGNTVEQWSMADGSGATVVATVTSPANDGAITSGTWVEQWDQEGTPVIPYSLEFDGAATAVNCGSDASIDDLPDAAFTAEAWVRADSAGEGSNARIVTKHIDASAGWWLYVYSGGIACIVRCATTNAEAYAAGYTISDRRWHHVAATFDDAGDRKIRIYLDGVLVRTSSAASGAYISDAAGSMLIGNVTDGSRTFDGSIGFVRLSNSIRYTANFIPPSRLNPPAPDGNTVAQYNFRDGAGTTLTDAVGVNNGTITMGSGYWNTVPALATDAPGARVFNWGYTLGADAADEGMTQIMTGLTAGANYVLRPIIHYEPDRRARPYIQIYDETNGATIVDYLLPFLTGTHDGGDAAAALSDTTAPYWPYSLIGATIYNITDGSSATVTATGTSITATLAGGTDNDWDNGDEYMIVPKSGWVFADLFCFELPTTARNGSAANCTSISVKVLNGNDEGVFYAHQVELQTNQVDNPSFETGAVADPWIPDGWTNYGLLAGDSNKDTTHVHSGSSSWRTVPAGSTRFIYQLESQTSGIYYAIGGWEYVAVLPSSSHIVERNGNKIYQQASLSTNISLLQTVLNSWMHITGVGRAAAVSMEIMLRAYLSGNISFDDAYFFPLTAVSLTVTPASAANSAESGGIRVDGRDRLYQTITGIGATSGAIQFTYRPRHNAADMVKFGNSQAYVCEAYGDANNYILLRWTAANTLAIRWYDAGGAHNGTWNATGAIVADTEYVFRIEWNASRLRLRVDGAIVATVNESVNFSVIPNIFNAGSSISSTGQNDAVFV